MSITVKTTTSPDPDSRQARRAARRKAEILEAAAKVFAEKGFHRTTTKDIAEAADIAEGTIYNYFDSKDDLLINLIDHLADLENRRRAYEQGLDIDFREFVHNILLQRFSILKERNTLFAAILPEVFASPNLRELYRERVMNPGIYDIEEHIRARIERGQLKPVDVQMVIRMFTALGLGLEFLTIIGDPEILAAWDDPDRLVGMIMSTFFEGLLPQPNSGDSTSTDH
jgi:AcrR family transcriptional regulator